MNKKTTLALLLLTLLGTLAPHTSQAAYRWDSEGNCRSVSEDGHWDDAVSSVFCGGTDVPDDGSTANLDQLST